MLAVILFGILLGVVAVITLVTMMAVKVAASGPTRQTRVEEHSQVEQGRRKAG